MIESALIAAAIADAPGWARVGITVPDRRLRAAALDALARHICERVAEREPADPRQLGLPL